MMSNFKYLVIVVVTTMAVMAFGVMGICTYKFLELRAAEMQQAR